jgi:hypothetical protein
MVQLLSYGGAAVLGSFTKLCNCCGGRAALMACSDATAVQLAAGADVHCMLPLAAQLCTWQQRTAALTSDMRADQSWCLL